MRTSRHEEPHRGTYVHWEKGVHTQHLTSRNLIQKALTEAKLVAIDDYGSNTVEKAYYGGSRSTTTYGTQDRKKNDRKLMDENNNDKKKKKRAKNEENKRKNGKSINFSLKSRASS